MGLLGKLRQANKGKSSFASNVKRGADKAFGYNDSWEERQAEKLQKLRGSRIKEESRGKLRAMEEKERSRISAARGKARGSSKLGKIGKGLVETGKVVGAMGEGINQSGGMFGPGPSPQPKPRKPSGGGGGGWVVVGGKAYKKGGSKKKKRSSSPQQQGLPFGF